MTFLYLRSFLYFGYCSMISVVLWEVVVLHPFFHFVSARGCTRIRGMLTWLILMQPLGGIIQCRAFHSWRLERKGAKRGTYVRVYVCACANITMNKIMGSIWVSFVNEKNKTYVSDNSLNIYMRYYIAKKLGGSDNDRNCQPKRFIFGIFFKIIWQISKRVLLTKVSIINLCISISALHFVYIYIYIYISLRKTKTGHIRIINLFPSCYGYWYESITPKITGFIH